MTYIPMAALVPAARGAALLDERMPGWWRGLDPDELAMKDPRACVLGRLYPEGRPVPRWRRDGFDSRGDCISQQPEIVAWGLYDPDGSVLVSGYRLGRIVLGLDDEACERHGFDVSSDVPEDVDAIDLDAAWAAEIDLRRAVAS